MAQLKLRKAHRQSKHELNPKASTFFPDIDFIPFVSHYSNNSILTKNGELLQVIKITGFNHESIDSELVNLREAIRDSITNNIQSNNFALWLHTVRRKSNIAPHGEFPDFFSQKLNEIWEEENNWKKQFVNELYLTIIIEGYDTSISNINSLLRSLSTKGTRNLHLQKLEKANERLTETTQKILEDLNSYGAQLLGIEEKKGVLYSLPMQFFGKIINLTDDRYPLSFNDMSEDLANKKMAFGNVSLQVQGEEDNDKHFAAMFSVKEYNEISVSILDKILQLPQEFIISQSIDFIDRNKALLSFDYQNYILDISEDDQLKYLSGLDSIIDSDSGSITDYGKQQITLMLINRNTGGLQDDIDNALSALHELGLVTVREDIFSEHCFWSQLPGNFKFLRRQKAINVSRIAGFASLHNFPAGSRMDNHWGDAVTIFRTVLGTPYFFNFHDGDAGHTMIIGPLGSGKTVLLNFLVGQSRKFNNRLFYFGYNRSAKIFINAIEGNYLSITNKLEHPNALKINPLTLIDRPDSEKFLSDWFGYLVNYGGDKIEDEEMKLIPAIVKKIITKKIKKLSDAAALFKTQQTKNIYKKLSIWHSKGKYAFIFDHEAENDFSKDLVNAFDLSPILKQKALLIPVISYLLHRVEISLDGKPAMIVLDEAWKLIDNYATGPKINDFLDRMEKKNCVIIFATESAKDAAQSSITKGIDRSVVTRIFLPDEEPTNYYKSVFGLNDDEFNILSAMSSEERHFLLKRGEDAIIASLDLSAINNVIAVLSSNPQNIGLMEAMKRKYGKKSADWVPEFFNALPQ